MCVIDLEPCDLWTETERQARKAHRCGICRGPIVPGERYALHFSKSDGEVCAAKVCALCQAARREFADGHDGQLCQPPGFVRLLIDCIDEQDEEDARLWKPMLEAIRARQAVSA